MHCYIKNKIFVSFSFIEIEFEFSSFQNLNRNKHVFGVFYFKINALNMNVFNYKKIFNNFFFNIKRILIHLKIWTLNWKPLCTSKRIRLSTGNVYKRSPKAMKRTKRNTDFYTTTGLYFTSLVMNYVYMTIKFKYFKQSSYE